MPKMRITKSVISSLPLPPGKKSVTYYDTMLPGFGVRVTQLKKSYIVHTRVKKLTGGMGTQVLVQIGHTSAIKYDTAVARARAILEDAKLGISPADRMRERENQQTATVSLDVKLKKILESYLQSTTLADSTRALYRMLVEKHLACWLNAPIRSITADMVLTRHAEIAEDVSGTTANNAMRVLRLLCNHAAEVYDGLLIRNPVRKLSTMKRWVPDKRREGYIRPEDLQSWFLAVKTLESDNGRDALLFMLFTGARKTEVLSLKWSNIDFRQRTVLFRETKNKKPLHVPLCQFLVRMLAKRWRLYCSSPESYVFPSYSAKGHATDIRASVELVSERSGVHIIPHDLRRTFQTYLEYLRVPPYTIKRLVNHAIPLDVTAGYIQFPMESLRLVVEELATFILARVNGQKGKVVLMKKQAS